MSTNAAFTARRAAAIPAGLSKHLDVYIEKAENAELWDVEGKRYIDFAAGIAVNNTGHRHPKVVERVRSQLDKVTHTSFQTTPYIDYVAVCEKLNALVPGDFTKKPSSSLPAPKPSRTPPRSPAPRPAARPSSPSPVASTAAR